MTLNLLILAAAAAMLAAIQNKPAEAAGEPLTLDLWPGQPPGETHSIGPEHDVTKPSDHLVGGRRVIRLGNVSRPTITLYRPNKEIDTGAAVLIAPGGGYQILAWDLEGTEVAEWLASVGVTGILLKYRVPPRPGEPADEPPVRPLQDAQRAMSLVRSRAREWGIDPHRIGMLGFSAGGNLTVRTATLTDRAYTPVDAVDRVSSRPDFMILVYPAFLAWGEGLAFWLHVTQETPPAFFVHAEDDSAADPESSIRTYLALKKAGVPAELHLYPTGGHGYGLRPTHDPVTTWPARCLDWLRSQGILRGKESSSRLHREGSVSLPGETDPR
jgi:acetyl esterase/lipase